MAVTLLRRLAAAAPVPVMVAVGEGGRSLVHRLLVDPEVELVDSPRHATVLLVAGAIPPAHHDALAQLHDQLPHPRGVLLWGGAPAAPAFFDPAVVAAGEEVVPVLRDLHEQVVTGARPTSPPALTGARGERSMAATGEDLRDGLALDRVPVTVGPFLAPWWPAGLVLDLELQGDLVVSAAVAASGADRSPDAGATVVDSLLALGHRSLARRWLSTPTVDRHRLTGRVTRALRDVPDLPDGADLSAVPSLLPGRAWREAVLTVVELGRRSPDGVVAVAGAR